jgi:DNA-binding GntR family transcriptional regulator
VLPSTLPRSASPDPRAYMQIAAAVRQRLDGGTLQPGDKVTITDLAESHGVSRQTAARGLRVLEDEGRLRRFPGFGYAVQATSATEPCEGQ